MANPILQPMTLEQMLHYTDYEEIRIVIVIILRNNKVVVADGLPAELLEYGGISFFAIHGLAKACLTIWTQMWSAQST